MKKNKVILTFQDEGDGKIEMNMEFVPMMKAVDKCSPAQSLALRCVEYLGSCRDAEATSASVNGKDVL